MAGSGTWIYWFLKYSTGLPGKNSIPIQRFTSTQMENNTMTKTILITGASGRVGRAAGDYLCSKGFEVIGASRSVREDDSCYTDTVQADLLDEEDVEELEEVTKNVDVVFHLAWNIPEENFDTHKAWKGNMEMYHNVLDAAKKGGVPTFVNGSSIHAGAGKVPAYSVDADFENTPQPYKNSIDPETDFDLRKENPQKLLDPREENPGSPYGWHKIMTERILKKATRKGDFDIGVSIRIGGVNSEDKNELEGEPFYPTLYWSHKDLGRTIAQILKADPEQKGGYHQFYGVSDNEGRVFNIENAFIGE